MKAINKIVKIPLALIDANRGQIEGVPANPRRLNPTKFELLKQNIKDYPDFTGYRALLVYPLNGRYVTIGGNMRREAMIELGEIEAPCTIIDAATPPERLKAYAILDNNSFGDWDFEKLQYEWDSEQLMKWGSEMQIAAKEAERELSHTEMELSTDDGEKGEEYNEFVDKFKPKLTTDDCYTPKEVYKVISDFVDRELLPLKNVRVIRPFYPNGDYTKEDYTGNCVVIDNPPFSISAEILRFYSERNIRYFLFGNALTAFSSSSSSSSVILTGRAIIYENGANVNTCFYTNLLKDIRVWCCPQLGKDIEDAQKIANPTKELPKIKYPKYVTSAALLGKIAKRIDYKILFTASERIGKLDNGNLFGGGLLLSEAKAKAEAEAEAEAKAKAEAEAKAKAEAEAIIIELSDREREIVKRLTESDKR